MRKGLFLFLSIILAVGIFTAGFYSGKNNPSVVENAVDQIITGGSTKIVTGTKPSDLDFSLFWEAWEIVDDKHIYESDNEERVEGAISGMLRSLDDPYSVYLTPLTNKRFLEDLEGHFDGIGAEIAIRDGYLTIVAPLEDSPAEKSGIKPKDIILQIDGKDTSEMAFDESIMNIRGEKGSTVVLNVIHDGETEPVDVPIIRDTIMVSSVDEITYIGDNNSIAVIKMNQFAKDSVSILKENAKEISKKGSKAIIIDLRNNPGGLLETAIDVVSLFIADDLSNYKEKDLKNGVVVIEESKNKNHTNFERTKDQLFSLPIVVLQNEGSASASEIFAGAIKDYDRGQIVGKTSFGKGSVQNLEELSNEGSVKVTIAKWLTPLGTTIDGKGIDPDVIIEEDETEERDPFIEKAVELLNSN